MNKTQIDINPASRLHAILKEVKSAPIQGSKQVAVGWSNLFQCTSDDLPKLFSGITSILNLIDEVEASIKELPEKDHELLLREIPAIRKIVAATNFESGWQFVKDGISEKVLLSVEFCANRVADIWQEKEIPKDELKHISDEINALFEEIKASDLPKAVKTYLLELLETMRSALSNYRITGAKGLRKAVAASIGTLVTNYGTHQETTKTPLVKRFWALVQFAEGATARAMTYVPALADKSPVMEALLRIGS